MGQGHLGHFTGDRPAWSELVAALDLLPLASLLLAADGTALAVSPAWAALSGVAVQDSLADGWLSVIEPPARAALRARLRDAAQARQSGYADVPLAARPSRWWWQPGPSGHLIVCVADLGDFRASYDGQPSARRRPGRLVGRSEFVNLAGRALRRSGHEGEYVAVMAVVFDGISIPPAPGGESAAELLRAAEERVFAAVGPAGPVAHLEPGEFVILLDGLRAPRDAEIVARQVWRAVSQPPDAGDTPVPVTVIAGLAVADGPGYSAEELIGQASRAARSRNRMATAEPLVEQAVAPRPGSAWPIMVGLMVHRLFGVGLTLQSASDLTDGPGAARLQQAADELDSVIRDIRTAVFEFLALTDSHDD